MLFRSAAASEPLGALALSLEGGRELLRREQTAFDEHLPEELPLAWALARASQRGDTPGVLVFRIHATGLCDHASLQGGQSERTRFALEGPNTIYMAGAKI